MKIKREEIENIMVLRDEWSKYVREHLDKDFYYESQKDKVATEKWNSFFQPCKKYGAFLYELIVFAEEENLTIDNVVNALKAMNVEVY